MSDSKKYDVWHFPGLGGSGEDHWQSIWIAESEKHHLVEQQDWEQPDKETWIADLARHYETAPESSVFVAHSLGCALAVHWMMQPGNAERIPRFAMFVAPADVDDTERTPDCVHSFAPMPMEKLPCPSIVVASASDPYVSLARAESMASAWGALFVSLGELGHLNADSGIGRWRIGEEILAMGMRETDNGAKRGMFGLDKQIAGWRKQ